MSRGKIGVVSLSIDLIKAIERLIHKKGDIKDLQKL